MTGRLIIAVILAGLWTTQVRAEATPNHVVQVARTILAELDQFHEANFSEPGSVKTVDAERRPRHVLQKAREVFLKVQQLRYINGLSPNQLDPLPVQAVKPADVKGLVDQILHDVTELRSAYGIRSAAARAALPDGMAPKDAYAHMAGISASLDGLGLPSVVPNDVFQIASTITADLTLIARKAGLEAQIATAPEVSSRTPGHVYGAVATLLNDLSNLVQTTSLDVVGGIAEPTQIDTKVSPADVLDRLNLVMADVGALKHAANVRQPTNLAPLQGGMTPSDVYRQIMQSRLIVQALLAW